MFRSIRARMTAVFSLSVALIMFAACGALIIYARHSAERNAQVILRAAVGKVDRDLGDEREVEDISRLMDEEREDLRTDGLSLFVVTDDGKVLQSTHRPSPLRAPADGKNWRTARARVGKNWLVAASPWAKTESALRSLGELMAALWLFVVALATAGGWMLVGRTLSPIALLSRQANAATIENLKVHLEEPSRDAEIVDLVATLNGLLSRLSETASAKGRFYSAASHELRTPLQALSGHLELALSRDRTHEEYHATVEEAYRQTRRLIQLTRNLLLLYQLDASAATLPDEPGDLTVICRDTLSQLQPIAEKRGLTITSDLPASAPFSAPSTHAEVLIRNLVENAFCYASVKGTVALSLDVHPDRIELGVFNECSVPEEWNPNRLFEPFARVDSSRNPETGGTGLGLTICKAIADANGWVLVLRREGTGVRAVLTLHPEVGTAAGRTQ